MGQGWLIWNSSHIIQGLEWITPFPLWNDLVESSEKNNQEEWRRLLKELNPSRILPYSSQYMKPFPLEGNSFIFMQRWLNDQGRVSLPKSPVYNSVLETSPFVAYFWSYYMGFHNINERIIEWTFFNVSLQMMELILPSFLVTVCIACLWRKEFPVPLCLNNLLLIHWTSYFYFVYSLNVFLWPFSVSLNKKANDGSFLLGFLNHHTQRIEWLFKTVFHNNDSFIITFLSFSLFNVYSPPFFLSLFLSFPKGRKDILD